MMFSEFIDSSCWVRIFQENSSAAELDAIIADVEEDMEKLGVIIPETRRYHSESTVSK